MLEEDAQRHLSETSGEHELRLQILGNIRQGQSALRRIRYVIGGTWFALSVVAAVPLVFLWSGHLIVEHGDPHCLTASHTFFGETLFDLRLLMSALAPLGDDTRFMQLVLGADFVVVAARRYNTVRHLSAHWWQLASWSEKAFFAQYMAKAAMCNCIAVWAMTRRGAEAMHTWLWRYLLVYAIMNMIEACLYELMALTLGGRCWRTRVACAVPGALLLYLVWDRRLLNWVQSQLCQWVDTTGATSAAASIACVIGPDDPKTVWKQARSQFRCITLDLIVSEDVCDNAPNPDLYARSRAITLGRCDAFVSHSWHDDADTKWTALQDWRASFVQSNGREPRLWFDKCCLDQSNIERDLRCLPMFLGGCRRLVILCGPTYLSRLWCIMEIFFFVMMGGRLGSIDLIPVTAEGHDGGDAMLAIVASFRYFDAAACTCFFEHDKRRMLTVIQTSFGSLGAFNRRVSLLLGELSGEVRCEMSHWSTDSSSSSSGDAAQPRDFLVDICDSA